MTQRFEDDPRNERRTVLAISVKGNPIPEGEIKVKEPPAMMVAISSHEGFASEFQRSYEICRSS